MLYIFDNKTSSILCEFGPAVVAAGAIATRIAASPAAQKIGTALLKLAQGGHSAAKLPNSIDATRQIAHDVNSNIIFFPKLWNSNKLNSHVKLTITKERMQVF